jgi:hypothetical protein
MLRALRPADKSARPIGKLKRAPEIKYILTMNAMTVGSVYGLRLAAEGYPGAHRIHEELD